MALRVGVIGGGGIAGAHLPHLVKRSDAVELVGIADINAQAAASTAEKYGVARHVTDYRELLPQTDAVLVCVPTWLHAEITVEALRAGKHVFCEKPMARLQEGADAMCRAAQESGKTLQIGFVRRFDDEWLAWRDAVQAAKIGRPVVWRDVAAISGPGAAWYNRDEQGGGPFLDGCIHNLDFALHTFGPAAWAFLHGRTMRPGNTAFDTGTATIHFESGDELLLAWTWGLPPGCSGARVFELLGPEGTLTWPRDDNYGATERHFVINRGEAGEKETVPFPGNALGAAFEQQMDEFIEAAQGRATPRAGGDAGRESLRLALAILESGRSGQVEHL